MDERKKGSSPLNIQTVLLVAAVVGGLYLVPSALRSSRPGEKESLERTSLGDQVVPARLWQDPLEAAKNYREKYLASLPEAERRNFKFSTNDFHSLPELASQIVRQCKQMQTDYTNKTPTITVLQVMISGGSYAADAETRHRARYAILSALGVAGYVPFDEEHIGYAEVQWPRGAELERFTMGQTWRLSSKTNTENGELIVPFEWFEPNQLQQANPTNASAPSGMVLVMWLNRDEFADHPAKRLAQLNRELSGKVGLKATNDVPYWNYVWRIRFKLLDPSLKALLNERFALTNTDSSNVETDSFSIQEVLDGIEVYSTYATTADTVLRSDFSGKRRDGFKSYLHDLYGLDFVNATCTDDELAAALCDELERRGVDFRTGKDCIALVSEWDTLYGRALPLTFAAEVLRLSNTNYPKISDAILALKEGSIPWPRNIYRFTYLRGVDGILPGEEPHKDVATKEATKTKEAGEPDRPEGHSQLDYMPRLAGSIEDLEARFKRSDHHELKAIGILGSDVYDKLLVLQTLRPYFTDELFFTTDLDTRMLHPNEQKWTRNVIVASSFGLKLHRKLQRTTPPFRDTAQTAEYLATLAAVGNLATLKVPTNILDELWPRLFEIGRNGAYDLSVQTNAAHTNLYPARLNTYSGTRYRAFYFAENIVWILLVVVLSLLLLVLLDPTNGKWRELCPANFSGWKYWRLLAMAALLPVVLVGGLIFSDHLNPRGEPFSLLEGISIWPTEIIRLFGVGLSIYFLLKARHELRESKDKFSENYSGLPRRLEKSDVKKLWEEERNRKEGDTSQKQTVGWPPLHYWRWISVNSWDGKEAEVREPDEKRVDATRLCETYNRLGFFRHRVYRFLPPTVIYVALGALLMGHFDAPFRPYRGDLSLWADRVAFYVSLCLQVILTFCVVDATCLCRKFISNLTKGPTVWPPQTSARFEEECRIHRDYLDEWIGLRVIADRTKVVGKLIFYPFIGLFLIIISRNSFFDRWDWPVSLILVLGVNSAYAIYSVLVLRRAAEKARHDALEQLSEKLLRVLGGEKKLLAAPPAPDGVKPGHSATEKSGPKSAEKDEPKLAEQIRTLLQKIKDYEEGAFAPLSQHPVVAALAMPFGGAGILTLLDFLAAR